MIPKIGVLVHPVYINSELFILLKSSKKILAHFLFLIKIKSIVVDPKSTISPLVIFFDINSAVANQFIEATCL